MAQTLVAEGREVVLVIASGKEVAVGRNKDRRAASASGYREQKVAYWGP